MTAAATSTSSAARSFPPSLSRSFYTNVDPRAVLGDMTQALPNSAFTVSLEDDAQKLIETVTYSGARRVASVALRASRAWRVR